MIIFGILILFFFFQPMGSMMIASNIISSSSSAELQNKLANILDENNLLRETLKENNTSIKEQFKTIVSWRDDVMKTYSLHRNKFAETKELIEKVLFSKYFRVLF